MPSPDSCINVGTSQLSIVNFEHIGFIIWRSDGRLGPSVGYHMPLIENMYRTIWDNLKQTWHKISIFHRCVVWIEKSVTRVTDRHHEACRVVPNSDPE